MLQRSLGLPALLFYGVGVIIGAGIYSVIGAASGIAGYALWQSFVLAAAVALLGGLSYAELATLYPRAGAEYVYLREALPDQRWAGFTVGMVVSVANAATAGTVAVAFAGYFQAFADWPPALVAFAVLALCTALNLAGLRQSTAVTVMCTLIEIAGLLLIIGTGWRHEGLERAVFAAPHAGVLVATALVFFVYTGFEGLANLAQETRRPERVLPASIFISLAVTTVLYVLVALAAVALVEPAQLARSSAPLAEAARRGSPVLGTALGWIALVSTFNTALITLVVGSRLLFGMADQGDLPKVLSKIQARRKTPWMAGLVMLAAAAAIVPLGEMEIVAGLSAFATLLAFIGVHVALIVLRFRQPDRRRPFRAPWSVGRLPLTPLLGIACCLALATQFEMPVYVAGAVAVVLGIGLFLMRRR